MGAISRPVHTLKGPPTVTIAADRLSPQIRATMWMVMTAVTFALSLVAIRELSPTFPASQVTFFRVFVGAVAMAPWLTAPGIRGLGRSTIWLYVGCGGASFAGLVVWNWVVPRMPLADATALNFTLPLFTVIFAILFLGEKTSPRRLAVTCAGFVGILVVLRPGFATLTPAAILALASAAAFAISVILIRVLSHRAGPGIVTFNMHLVMVPLAIAASVAEGWVWPGWADIPWVLAIGILGTLSYVGVIRTLGLVDASVYAAFDFLRLPCATLVAIVFFSERPDVWTWIGGAIILGATWTNARMDSKRAKAA